MISLTSILLSIAFGSIVYYILFNRNRKGKKYPNGPFSLPFIGNLHQFIIGPHIIVGKWAKQFGDLYKIKFGTTTCYVISDLKILREAFNDTPLNGRAPSEALELLRGGQYGIAVTNGQEWTEQRRFTLRHLRDFGFGKTQGEEIIMVEVNELLSTFAKEVGKPFDLDRTFNIAILNTLWMITTGNRYTHDDPQLWTVFNQLKSLNDKIGRNAVLVILPTLAKMFPKLSGWKLIENLTADMHRIIDSHIDDHRKTFPEDGVPRDFVDAYLKEIESTTDTQSSFYGSAGITSLKGVMVDFFGAGSDTITNSLLWGVLYLCRFQDKQKKLQQEMDDVVGRNRHPSLSDRLLLPYAEATIAEMTRYASLFPLGLLHYTLADGKINGYDIPKGTQVMGNFYGIHFNEKYFPNPKEFRPERFLSPDGKTFQKSDAVLAFSLGKRVCLGETLARDQLFLYLTNMFHRFNISFADESKDVSIIPDPKFVLTPPKYKVIMTSRE